MLWVTLIVTSACGRWGFDQNRNGTDDATIADADVDAFVDRPNRILMSTAMFDGALGGLAGADMKCQTAADAKGFGGTWKAVLQSSLGPPSGRFAGSRGWVDPTGRVIADQQAEAVAVGLPSTMLAFLATPNVTAEARFSGVGEPWRRVDGVRIAQTAALVGPQPVAVWDSFIGRTADNQPTGARVWTGTQSQNCNNWNSGLGSQSGSIGNSSCFPTSAATARASG